ncbi:MAG: serine/threonine protein kinase [Frankiales bacterium]|nr:serine/threonine protein kinase [Frankiales bacterium]
MDNAGGNPGRTPTVRDVSDPVSPNTVPPVVPGYTLEALIGRGGSGEVWRAVPRAGGPDVAVKVLVAGDPERQAREAALLGELDHPHLVRLHEVVHQPRRGGVPRVALVLDLLAGGSLAALLARRGRLRSGEVVTAIAPVAAALAHVHAQGVVHGDLSPGNIVFTAEGRPVLTDLGVARVLGEEARGEVTPAYVDPTVARGGAPGPASDVFGIAAAAFHALTGIAPWNGAGPAGTLAVAAAGELPDLTELAPEAPPELRAVIARGLAPEPADRGSAAAFALDLRHACRPEPVRLPVPGVPDGELGGTGRGPRTELTHQVRRAPSAAVPVASSPTTRRSRGLEAARGLLVAATPRRVLLLVAVVAVLGASIWAGGRWGRGSAPDAARASVASVAPAPASGFPDRREPPDSPAGWQRLVSALYLRRAGAFTTGSAGLLGDVYAAGSTALAADEQAVAALAAHHLLARGFAPQAGRVTDARVSDDRAELRLTDSWGPYQVVGSAPGDAEVVSSVPGRDEEPVRMELVRTAAGWRILTVTRLG